MNPLRDMTQASMEPELQDDADSHRFLSTRSLLSSLIAPCGASPIKHRRRLLWLSCLPPVIFSNFLFFFFVTTNTLLLPRVGVVIKSRLIYLFKKKEVLCWGLSKTIKDSSRRAIAPCRASPIEHSRRLLWVSCLPPVST